MEARKDPTTVQRMEDEETRQDECPDITDLSKLTNLYYFNNNNKKKKGTKEQCQDFNTCKIELDHVGCWLEEPGFSSQR